MFDFEQLMKGYTKEDEFIARDLLLMELLIEKGIITEEEINKKYASLPDKIKKVHKNSIKVVQKEIDRFLKDQ